MTNRQFSLMCDSDINPEIHVRLRTIRGDDQTALRNWKNQNRQSFFFNEVITEHGQLKWFANYLTREDDYMFIVEVENCCIGCTGIRLLEDSWDIYNVILGDIRFSKKGYMRQALHMMCSWGMILSPIPITAKVLNENPAIDWYCRSGFEIVSTYADHVKIELCRSSFESYSLNLYEGNTSHAD